MTVANEILEPARLSAESPAPRTRLDFLDGIRALAALYVVQYHSLAHQDILPVWVQRLLTHGTMGVAVFIVLSGYCLMLPVARSAKGELRGSTINYLKRRARRILPPYYAALVFTIVLVLFGRITTHVPLIAHPASADLVMPPINLLLHVTMLHNLSLTWYQTLDPPMWSVAPEWQIYFLFPLVLLPLWRRFGMLLPLLLTLLIGALPHLLLPDKHNGDYLHVWYITLFTIGMMSAVVSFTAAPQVALLRKRIPWAALTGVSGAIILVLVLRNALGALWDDLLVGVFMSALLIYCADQANAANKERRSPVMRLLESRPLVTLGVFSYSVYLIHMPARWLMQPPLHALHLAGRAALLYEICVFIPFSLFVSYLFYLVVERRFMPGHPHTTRQAARAAEISPAP